MKKGTINIYGIKLYLAVDNEKIVTLSMADDVDGENMNDKEEALWQDKINRKDYQLEFRGSDFDKQVWAELLKIPEGHTVTYQQVANGIGSPKAVRAVANAVGRNRIVILVPCHRVIRTDGTMGGSYWGVEMKKQFLSYEKAK